MADAGPPLFRAFHDVLRLPAGRGAEVVYAPLSRRTHVLPAARARVLFACRGLATLEQHAARTAAELGGDAAAHRAELAELASAGLLVSAGDLVRRLQQARPAEPAASGERIASLGVPTRGRAAGVGEALDTYVEDARRHGRSLDYVVADGAAGEAEAAPTRAVATEIAARPGVSLAYAGPAEKARYAAKLAARAGADPEIVAFALLGDARLPLGTGANRNALLLHAAGELLLQVDDDTRCRVRGAPDPLPGLAVTSVDDPTELWPLAERLPATAGAGRAFVALHEDLLGRAAGDCIAAVPGGLELGGATGMLFRRLAGRGGRVVATQSGSGGDAATGSMAHLLRLEGRSRERLLADEGTYQRALERRQVIRAAPRAAIGDGAACITMGLGLDARGVLPPFVPVQRNAGGVFAVVLRRCLHDALLGFVPWTVEHEPPEARDTSPAACWASFDGLLGNDLLRLLVAASRVEPDRVDAATEQPPPAAGASLRALGEALSRWGSLPLADFEEVVRVQVLRARSLDLLLFEEALRRHGRAPAFWARDVDRAVALLRAGVPRPESAWPTDFVAALGEAEGRACFQSVVRRYGELLRVWPDLWNAALALRVEGVRVAVRC